MKKIILPTDFSENAYNAITYAVQLFKDVETTFYLLHTYTPAVFRAENLQQPNPVDLEDQNHTIVMEQLKELQQRLQKEFPSPKHIFVPQAVFNTLTDEVEQMVERDKTDLIIMGTKGASNVLEVLLGTNTTEVMRRAKCPLIVVPSGFEYNSPKEIIFSTDYEVDYQDEQLRQLLGISESHASHIDVIHVSSGQTLRQDQLRNKQKLEQLLAQAPHTFHHLPDQGVIEAINIFKADKPTALLVMIRNKHTFLERLFFEPIIKKIGLQITIPFMVIPHSN